MDTATDGSQADKRIGRIEEGLGGPRLPSHRASCDHVGMLSELIARLDAVEAGLAAASAADPPPGLTEPDPDGDERWEAGQVWAHMAEFVPYWTAQVEHVIGQAATVPVPFGRVHSDPDRIAAIERDRRTDPLQLMARVSESVEQVRVFLAELEMRDERAVGLHQVRGPMTVAEMLENFVVAHLEEHAEQLEALAAAPR